MRRTKSVQQKLEFGPKSRIAWVSVSDTNVSIEMADSAGRNEQSVALVIPPAVAEQLVKKLATALDEAETEKARRSEKE